MSNRGLVIRRATRTDATSIITGINAVCTEGGAFYTTKFQLNSQWKSVLFYPEQVKNHMLSVAELDGNLIGASRLFPGTSHTLYQHVAELGMFVYPKYRGQGVGSQLLEWMINWATSVHIEKIVLCVFSTNVPAIRLYEKFGFTIEGRQRKQLKTADQYTDLLWMALFLKNLSHSTRSAYHGLHNNPCTTVTSH